VIQANSDDNNKNINLVDFASQLARRKSRERNKKSRGLKISSGRPCLAFNIAGGHGVEYILVIVCARSASKRRISISFVEAEATAELRCEMPSSSETSGVMPRVCVLLLSNRAETFTPRGSFTDLQDCWPSRGLLWLSRRYIYWISAVVKAATVRRLL